jgi:hypothetical protein
MAIVIQARVDVDSIDDAYFYHEGLEGIFT